jgi:hypothetical protein
LNLHTGSNLKTDLRFQRFDFETGILRKYDFQAEPTHQLVCGTAYVVVIIVVALVPATAIVMRNETVDPPTPARRLAPIAAETVVSRRFGGSVSKPHQKCKNNNNNNKQKHGFDA